MWVWRHIPNSRGSELCFCYGFCEVQQHSKLQRQHFPQAPLAKPPVTSRLPPQGFPRVVSLTSLLPLPHPPRTDPSQSSPWPWVLWTSLSCGWSRAFCPWPSYPLTLHLGDLSSLSSPLLSRILSLCLQCQTLLSTRLNIFLSNCLLDLSLLWKVPNTLEI